MLQLDDDTPPFMTEITFKLPGRFEQLALPMEGEVQREKLSQRRTSQQRHQRLENLLRLVAGKLRRRFKVDRSMGRGLCALTRPSRPSVRARKESRRCRREGFEASTAGDEGKELESGSAADLCARKVAGDDGEGGEEGSEGVLIDSPFGLVRPRQLF
jgi:hypothetical protein